MSFECNSFYFFAGRKHMEMQQDICGRFLVIQDVNWLVHAFQGGKAKAGHALLPSAVAFVLPERDIDVGSIFFSIASALPSFDGKPFRYFW